MKFVVFPKFVTESSIVRSCIITDDYSPEEVSKGLHRRHIYSELHESIDSWKSNKAFVYPLTDSGIDTSVYSVISLV